MGMPILVVDNVHKKYGNNEVLKGISFQMERGQTKVIIGPSGTGKSTLLRCINRLVEPDQGRVILDGITVVDTTEADPHRISINRIRSRIGMVFQEFNLFMHLTALDNVRIGLTEVKRLNKREATEKAMSELDKMGLADKCRAYPAELSGGQQQRVSIARALAMEPTLMLFDEPTSALDPELIGEVLQAMMKLASEGRTMVCVTHELGFARAVADEIIFLHGGQILEQGAPRELFRTQQHARTRAFLQQVSALYGKEQQLDSDSLSTV